MRLIDADALVKNRAHAKQYQGEMYVIGQGYVMDAPTIGAVEVKHGEWQPYGEFNTVIHRCDDGGIVIGCAGWKYCPNCGAKMLKDGAT